MLGMLLEVFCWQSREWFTGAVKEEQERGEVRAPTSTGRVGEVSKEAKRRALRWPYDRVKSRATDRFIAENKAAMMER